MQTVHMFTFNEKLFLLTDESLTGLYRTTKGTRYALIISVQFMVGFTRCSHDRVYRIPQVLFSN